MSAWPKTLQPVRPDRKGDALVLDEASSPATVFQLEAATVAELNAWLVEVGHPAWNTFVAAGGPVVILSAEGGAVGLGDYAVLRDGAVTRLGAGELHNAFQEDPPIEPEDEETPVGA